MRSRYMHAVRALIGCRITFYNEAARGDIYFTQSVVRARVSEAPVDLLGRERRATAQSTRSQSFDAHSDLAYASGVRA